MALTVLVSNSMKQCVLYICIQHLWECNAVHNHNCDQVTRLLTNGLSMNTTIPQWWPFIEKQQIWELYCNTTILWRHVKCLTMPLWHTICRCRWVCCFFYLPPGCWVHQHTWKLSLQLQHRIPWKWIHLHKYEDNFKCYVSTIMISIMHHNKQN